MLSFILLIAFTVVWYALLVFIAWAVGGIVAAIIVALLIPIVLIFCAAMCRAAELGDLYQMKFKKGH
jgi:hypothetical protein